MNPKQRWLLQVQVSTPRIWATAADNVRLQRLGSDKRTPEEHQKQKTLVLGLGSLRSCVFLHGKDVCIDKTDETDAAVLACETSVVEKDDGRKVPVIRVGVAWQSNKVVSTVNARGGVIRGGPWAVSVHGVNGCCWLYAWGRQVCAPVYAYCWG